jgi:hypothetical protein
VRHTCNASWGRRLRLRQKYLKSEASLGSNREPCLKKQKHLPVTCIVTVSWLCVKWQIILDN